MQRKVVGFIVCTLLITTSCFVVGANNHKEIYSAEPMMTIMADEWTMFRHDHNNTGYSTSPAPNDNNVLWSKHLGGWVNSNPTIQDGKLYIASCTVSQPYLWCLDAFTGDEIWVKQIQTSVWGSPTIANNRLYILGDAGLFYCINATSGATQWTKQELGHCSPMVLDDKVYFTTLQGGSFVGGFHCLNATNGEVIWEFDMGTSYQGCTPAIVDEKVYVGNDDGIFYCLNADTGDEIWNYNTGSTTDIWCSPSVYNGKVYFSSNQFYCLDAEIGDVEWIVPEIGTPCSPAIAYGYVYIGDYYNDTARMICLDADTGDFIWISSSIGNSVWNAAAVADGKVYICTGGSPGKFNCLDAYTGDIIWQYDAIDMSSYSSPAIAYGNVYVGTGSGYIYAFGTPNDPPDIPSIPDGPDDGITGVEYNFTTSTDDPELDEVYYMFDWGDGTFSEWIGPFPSGTTGEGSHAWESEGDYEVRAKAKDINDLESDWSPAHTITIVEGPILEIGRISGGFLKIKAIIRNIGDADAIDVHWYIALEGGLILIGRNTSGENLNIPAGGEETVSSSIILGFGQTTVIVKAWIPDGPSDKVEFDMFVFIFYFYIKPGGGI